MSPCGELPDGWSWSTLYECCQGIFDCPHSTPQLTDDGPYVVRTQDILTGVFRVEQAGHVSHKTYEERVARAVPSYGDLLYSREGTYFGIAAEVPKDTLVCLGQRMVLIRPDERLLDFRYLRYWLNSPMMSAYIHGFRDGSVAERLNLPTIRGLPVVIPSLPEQRSIAHVLGTLDDKIELNRQMNQTLEQIAAALFKSWFVDFDPVRAKAEGRQPEGMDSQAAALFPDRFVESEIGEIPEGWAVRELGEVCIELRRGLSPKYVDIGGIQVLNQRCIRDHRLDMTKARRHDDMVRPVEGRLLKVGDVLVNSTGVGTLGRVAQILSLEEPTIADSHVTVVRANLETVSTTYLGLLLVDREEEIESMGEGSTGQTELARSRLSSLPIVTPPRQILAEADKTLVPLFQRMQVAQEESGTLEALRDTLLPRLLSGELRVPIDVLDEEAVPMQPQSEEFLAQSRF